MSLILCFSVTILAAYVALIICFLTGWFRLRENPHGPPDRFPFVSVVVAVRNEEKNIEQLLNNLLSQEYPRNRYEIIIIDDHSNDRTIDIAESFKYNHTGQIKILSLDTIQEGKKQALDKGIKNALGELILTTDADCRVSVNWIASFVAFYLTENNPEMILGLVDLAKERGVFSSLQNLEFLSLIGCGAGAAAIGKPLYCNAANLMFKRTVYFELHDPLEKIAVSGDDTFLLHQVKTKFPAGIKMLKSKDAVVITHPAESLKKFLSQRIRWASKGRYYKDFDTVLVAVIVIFANLALMGWMIGNFLFHVKIFTWLIAAKIAADWLIIKPVLSFFEKKKLHVYVPVLSVIYPLYTTAILIVTVLFSFEWKGRVYRN